MLRRLLIFSFVIKSILLYSQGWNPSGARSMSLANTSVALTDVWSVQHNPGAVGTITEKAIGFSYENRFALKELQQQSIVYAHPLKKGVVSFGAQINGFSLYRSSRVGLGYAMKLSERLFMGVQLNYLSLRITNYGQKGNVSGEFGVFAKVTDKINFGFSVLNLNRAKLSPYQDDRFSTFLRMGISYALSSKVSLLTELEKEVESKLRPKGAIEYQFSDQFFFRMGVGANPVDLASGIGMVFKKRIKLDLGTAWSQRLGWSPHFGLNYIFKSKVNE